MKEIKKMLKRTVGNLLILALVLSMFAGVTLVSADAALYLTDITVNGDGVYGFESSTYEYTVDVPYTYTKNSFDIAMPVIEATANYAEADVDIDYPDTVNGGVATVTVSDDSQSVVYSLTLNPIGVNKYTNPGFEDGTSDGWNGNIIKNGGFAVTSDDTYAGNYSAVVTGPRLIDANNFYKGFSGLEQVNYVVSWAIKTDFIRDGVHGGWSESAIYPIDYQTRKSHAEYFMDGTLDSDNLYWDTKINTAYIDENYKEDGTDWRRQINVFVPNDAGDSQFMYRTDVSKSTYDLYIDDAYMSELIVADVDVTASKSWVAIPENGSTTVQLTAKLKNQFANGAGLEGVTGITWNVVGEPQGVTIDQNGLLTITSEASADTIKVDASVELGDEFVQAGATGRINIGISSATAANLADIEVNGNGIYGFESSKYDYTVDVPYMYTPNDFSVDMPEITAKAINPDATVEITYPESIEGGVAKIAVTSADGYQKAEYNLTLNPIGVNKYTNPGFEDGTSDGWNGNIIKNGGFAVTSDDTYAGNYSAVVTGPRLIDANNFYKGFSGLEQVNYVVSWAVKTDFIRDGVHGGWSESSIYPMDYQTRKSHAEYFMDGTLDSDNLYWDTKINTAYIDENYKEDGTDWRRQINVFVPNDAGDSQFMYRTDVSKATYDLYIDDAYMSELIVADVDVISSDDNGFVTIPENENATINLTAKLLNQFGNGAGLEGEDDISWRVVSAPEGVSIDNNVVTVAPDAKSGVITVEASVTLGDDFAQEGVTGRIDIVLLPQNVAKKVSYKNSEGTIIESIESGVITPVLTYTNDKTSEVKLQIFSAVYSKNGGLFKLDSIKENNIRLGAYETFDGDLKTINVPLGTGYIVKSFVWTDNYTPLMESIPLQ